MDNNILDLVQASGMTLAEFSRFFDIPYRTVQNWVYGVRECPTYLLQLMAYRLEAEFPPAHPDGQ